MWCEMITKSFFCSLQQDSWVNGTNYIWSCEHESNQEYVIVFMGVIITSFWLDMKIRNAEKRYLNRVNLRKKWLVLQACMKYNGLPCLLAGNVLYKLNPFDHSSRQTSTLKNYRIFDFVKYWKNDPALVEELLKSFHFNVSNHQLIS